MRFSLLSFSLGRFYERFIRGSGKREMMPAENDYEVISFAVKKSVLEKVDALVRSGSFVSRSELIRAALLHYLREAEEEAEKLGELLGRHKDG
jgi:hypothetical protein